MHLIWLCPRVPAFGVVQVQGKGFGGIGGTGVGGSGVGIGVGIGVGGAPGEGMLAQIFSLKHSQ